MYRAYGWNIESALDFGTLRPAQGRPDLRLRLAVLPGDDDGWLDVWDQAPGMPWVCMRRWGTGYAIRYVDQVDFLYEPADRTLTIDVQDCAPAVLRHFILDQVLPLIFSVDTLVLHGSAAAVDGRAVAFLGRGGSGKSTLAALLGREGHPILSDDAIVVRARAFQAVAFPAYPGVRLSAEMAAAVGAPGSIDAARKTHVTGDLPFRDAPAPIEHVFLMDAAAPAALAIEPLSARDTAMAFLEHAYRLDRTDGAALSAEMTRAFRAASVVCASRLAYPRERGAWPRVVAAVVAHVREHSARACCR